MFDRKTTHFVFAILFCTKAISAFGDQAFDQFKVASVHYRAQRWELASIEYREFLAEHPKHDSAPSALYYLGESLSQQKKFKQAADSFEQFVQSYSTDRRKPRALFRWGESAMLAGDSVTAKQILKRFHGAFPEHQLNDHTLFYLGLLSDYKEATKYYAALREQFPDSQHIAEAQLQIGVAHFRAGRRQAAMAAFGKIELDYPLEDNKKSVNLRVRTRYWMGITQLADKEYHIAASTLLSIHDLAINHPLSVAANYFAAEAFRIGGDLEAAETLYEEILQGSVSKWQDDAAVGLLRTKLTQQEFEQVELIAAQFYDKYGGSELIRDVRQLHARSQMARKQFALAMLTIRKAIKETPDRPSDSLKLMLSICHLAEKEWSDALKALESIELRDGNRLVARTELVRGCANLELGDYAAAIDNLNLALSELTEAAMKDRCRAKLVHAHLGRGEHAAAEEVFAAMTGEELSSRLVAARRIADRLFADQEYHRARDYYLVIADGSDPKSRDAGYYRLGWCYYRIGEYESAARTFQHLMRPSSVRSLFSEARWMVARSLEMAGKTEEAIAAYESIIAVDDPFRQRSMAQVAQLYLDTDRIADAKRSLRDAVKQFPDSKLRSTAAIRLAHIQIGEHNIKGAKKTMEMLAPEVTLQTLQPFVKLIQARIYAHDNQWNDALKLLEQLELESCHVPALNEVSYWLAESHYRLGNYDAAEQRYAALAKQMSSTTDAQWQALVPLRKAQLFAARGQWFRAAQHARIVREEFPKFRQTFEANYLLGRSMAMKARFADARSFYNEVLQSTDARQTETAAMAQWMIGETYFHQKKFGEAIRAYLKVDILYKHRKWQAAALLQAAKCFELTDDFSEAVQLYSRIISDYSDTTFAEQAYERYDELQQATDYRNETAAINTNEIRH